MDEWTIKTPNPICRLSFSWPVNRLWGILFNRFYRLEIHSLMVCIFDPAWELLPPRKKELYFTCVLLPLYCTFSLTAFPLSTFPMYSIFRQSVTGGRGGGVLKCTVDHILQEFNTLFLTRFRTYKIAKQPQTKVTSKDDIKWFVSLKFLRLCWQLSVCDPDYKVCQVGYPVSCSVCVPLANPLLSVCAPDFPMPPCCLFSVCAPDYPLVLECTHNGKMRLAHLMIVH